MRFAKSGPATPKSSVPAHQTENAQENFGLSALTSCLVDADENTATGAGRARRKALGVSALVQFCTLVALLVVPLFATGSRLILRPTNFVPLPPYGGAPKQPPQTNQRTTPPRTNHPTGDFFPVRQIIAPTKPQTNIAVEDADPRLGAAASSNTERVAGGNGTGDLVGLLGGDPNNGTQPPRPEVTPVATPRKPITVSQGVELALLIHRVEPIYPMFAKQTHREGAVELRATIAIDGSVRDVQVLSGDPVLAQAARDAVTQWRFRPTLLNGIPVEVISFFTVNFHIEH